jgi:hypothetical protein
MGWTRVDPRPWTTKLDAYWTHASGWTLVHCGHPTANYPWALYDPKGRMHLQSALHGEPTYGRAWRVCLDAMTYAALRGPEGIARMDEVQRLRPSEVRGGSAGGVR